MAKSKDLTVGNPTKLLISFCIPLFLSAFFQQLYSIGDSIIAGSMIGNDALSEISNSYEVTLVFIAFAFGCNIGASVIVAGFYGAKNYSKLKTAVFTSTITSLIMCFILFILGITLSTPLLRLLNTKEELLNNSRDYLLIYCYSLPFVFLYNISTGIFSALGDSNTPFIFLAISSVANVLVDAWFAAAGFGVVGLAWATFICQAVAGTLATIVVLRKITSLKEENENKIKIFDIEILKSFLLVAIPSILQQSFISIGNLIIQSEINSYGGPAMAGYGASVKLNNIVITSLTAVGNGISNYTAQNLGANKPERVKKGFVSSLLISYSLLIPITLIYLLLATPLLSFFIDDTVTIDNPQEKIDMVYQIGKSFLYIVVPFYIVIATKLASDGVLRGTRLMKQFMIATLLDLVIRVGLSFVFNNIGGVEAIWWSWPIGWAASLILSLFFFLYNYKKNGINK